MKEQSVFIQFDNVEFFFYLFDDEIDEAMRKKLIKLGVPDIQFKWPENQSRQFKALPNGLFKQGNFECNGISVTDATSNATCSAVFDPSSNVISVTLNGEFFCVNSLDEDFKSFSQQRVGFVEGARFRDSKGKLIKKPKDEWGVASFVEGRIVKNSYEGESQRVEFKITVKDGLWQNLG